MMGPGWGEDFLKSLVAAAVVIAVVAAVVGGGVVWLFTG